MRKLKKDSFLSIQFTDKGIERAVVIDGEAQAIPHPQVRYRTALQVAKYARTPETAFTACAEMTEQIEIVQAEAAYYSVRTKELEQWIGVAQQGATKMRLKAWRMAVASKVTDNMVVRALLS